MNLKSKWQDLPGRKKHLTIIVGVVSLVIVGALVFGDNEAENPLRTTASEDKNVNVFNTGNARDTGIDGLASQVRQMQKSNEVLLKELDRLREENEGLSEAVKKTTEAEALSKALTDIRAEIGAIKKENENLETIVDEYRSQRPVAPSSNGGTNQHGGDDFGVWEPEGEEETTQDDYTVSANPMKDFADSEPQSVAGVVEGSSESDGAESAPAPRMITSVVEASPEKEEDASKSEDDEGAFLPAGSIISGVLLTGMDAPTGSGARQDPFPATIRINKEAILPNRFRADVRECFMLVSGHGDLSSERAYLRSETISCVRQDGGVIETGLRGYASGEDGKAGIRGRLVSKQGSIIAKSLMAGFMSGAAEAFDVDSVPVINTESVGDSTQYQSNYDPKMIQGAASSGASSALERIAQFYIDMAEGMYPVIEIDAGRQIDVIVTSGSQLKLQG